MKCYIILNIYNSRLTVSVNNNTENYIINLHLVDINTKTELRSLKYDDFKCYEFKVFNSVDLPLTL